MAGMTGFHGGMLGLALAAVAAGVAQQSAAPRAPVQPAAETLRTGSVPQVTALVPPPAVAMLDGLLLDLTRRGGGDTAEVPLFVINRDASPVHVVFKIALSDSVTGRDTSYAASVEPDTVHARQMQVLQLRIPPGWRDADGIQRGHLTMTADNGTAPPTLATRQVRIAPAAHAPRLMDLLLGIGFGLGIAVVAITWVWKGVPSQAPPLTWNRESWASNLTIVGSALVTFSGLAAPGVVFHHLSRAQYTSLGAVVSGVIVLANAFYAFTSAERPASRKLPLALALVLSATLGAAFSQLITLGMLVREAYEASILTSAIYAGTNLVVTVTGFALFVYGVRTVSTLSGAAPAAPDRVVKRAGGGTGPWPLP